MTILRRATALMAASTLATLVAFSTGAQEGEYGTIPSAFTVTQLGEASYSMAIDMPEGPGGVQPKLSLEYRHRSGDGQLGVGWKLGGLSQITRCPQTVAQDGQARGIRFDSGDRFCLDGQRLVVINGTYGAAGSEYRTEVESFRKIVAYGQQGNGPAYFLVTDRDGTQTWYGHFYGSSLTDTSSGSYRQWAINTIRDTFTNDIEIHWTTGAAGELLPNTIDYSKNLPQGLNAQYRASFVYEDKPAAHQRTAFQWGGSLPSAKRLKTINIEHFSGSWQSVRRYELGYVPQAAAPHHSLLEKVQLCGTTTTCINGSWFTWADGQINTSGFGPQQTSSANPSTGQVYVGDFNGDGKEDVASPQYLNDGTQVADHRLAIYYSNGWAFNPADVQFIWYCSEYRVIEFNGDGRADLLCVDSWHAENNQYQVPAYLYIYESTTSGWVYRGTPAMAQWDPIASRFRVLTGDINGDGLTDLIASEANNWQIRLATGSGYGAPTSVGADAQSQPTSLTLGTFANMDDDQALELVVPWLDGAGYGAAVFRYNASGFDLHRYITESGLNLATKPIGIPNAPKPLPDINGDGRPDLLYQKAGAGTYVYTRLNHGNGFGTEVMTNVPVATLNFGRYLDVNNDGRDDLLLPTGSGGSWQNHLSNGATLVAGAGGVFPVASALHFSDVTGDGRRDAVYYDAPGGTWYVHPHLAELETVTTFWDGKGNWQRVTYQPLGTLSYFYNWSTPSLPATRQYRGPLIVVDQVEANSGIGMQSYSYATGVVGHTFLARFWYWDAMMDNRGRGFLGFGWFRTRDYRRDFHVDQIFHHPFPRTGWPSSSRRATSETAFIDRYDAAPPVETSLGPGRYFVHIDSETFTEYELNQQLTRTISRTRTFNTTSGAIDLETVTTQAHSGETYTTSTDYTLLNLGACLGLPDLISVTRSGHNMAAQTRTIDNVFYPTCRVLSSTNQSEAAAAMQLKQSFTFDGFGNVKTITLDSADGTAADRQTEFFYETNGHPGHLPSSIKRYITGEVPHTESFSWDYNLVLPLSHTEMGGVATTWLYNDLGRRTRETRADGSYTDFVVNMGYVGYMQNSIPAHATYGSDGSSTWEYLDSYGRVVGTQTRLTPNWSRISAKRFFYDEAGNLDAETQPFIWGDPEYLIGYQHDSLGRLASASRPTSEQNSIPAITTWGYDRLTSTVTTPGSPYNQMTTSIRDAIGRTVRVIDSAGGQSNYKYNAFDQLTETKDPDNHITTIAFNNRGDRVSLTDPDLGGTVPWTFPEYTVFGELQRQVDAKGQSVTFGYDQLGRLRTRSEPDFSNQHTVFAFYNTADYRHGLLQSETAPAASGFVREYFYDVQRRPYQERTRIDGTDYWTEFAYHLSGAALGKLQRITYPTSSGPAPVKVDYEYDGVGSLWQVKDGAGSTVFYQRNQSDALLRETSVTLGSGHTESRAFDRANLALKLIQTGPGNSIQNLSYDWFPSGVLERRTDTLSGRIEAFTYDALNRLDTQTINGTQALNVDYYADGNIQFKTGVGIYSYGTATVRPHAVHSVTGVLSNSYGYDANGNMQNRDGDTITWTSFNLPKKIDYGSSSTEFWYGTDRSRSKQVAITGSGTITTRYIGGHFEVESQSGLTIYRHFIRAGGRVIAQLERRSDGSSPIRYLHRDHLGSVVATTDSDGVLKQRFEYEPFGTRWRTAGSGADDTERGFTGHEHLDSVDLIHMNGRVQDPMLGRFISADSFVQAPYHSPSLNRYSYVWNNPATFVDPSGFQTNPCQEGMSGIDCDTLLAMDPDYHAYPRVIFGTDLAALDRLIRSNIESPPLICCVRQETTTTGPVPDDFYSRAPQKRPDELDDTDRILIEAANRIMRDTEAAPERGYKIFERSIGGGGNPVVLDERSQRSDNPNESPGPGYFDTVHVHSHPPVGQGTTDRRNRDFSRSGDYPMMQRRARASSYGLINPDGALIRKDSAIGPSGQPYLKPSVIIQPRGTYKWPQ